MRKHLRALLTGTASILLIVSVLAQAAIAQSDTKPISVEVLGYGCQQQGATTVTAIPGGIAGDMAISPESDSNGTNFYWPMNLQLNVLNAGCGQWSVTTQITNFELAGDSTKSFPGSTLRIARNSSIPNSPSFERWTNQPAWVQALPPELAIGNPVLPAPLAQNSGQSPSLSNSVSFSGAPSPYVGSGPILQSNPAAYGSPGNMSAYYVMRLFNLPEDLYLNPGIYTANITISMQGAD